MKKMILIVALLISMLSVANAQQVQFGEDGNLVYEGGTNSFQGKDATTMEEAKALEEDLVACNYVRFDKLPQSDQNRLLSAEQNYPFTEYVIYPFDSEDVHVWLYSPTVEDALAQLKENPFVEDDTFTEFICSTVVVTYFSFRSVSEVGEESDRINDKLAEFVEEMYSHGFEREAYYAIFTSPIDAKVVFSRNSNIHTIYAKANQPINLLIYDLCYVETINDIDVSTEEARITCFDRVNELDITELVNTYNIESKDYGVAYDGFSMSYEEWVDFYENLVLGDSWKKPKWSEGEIIVTPTIGSEEPEEAKVTPSEAVSEPEATKPVTSETTKVEEDEDEDDKSTVPVLPIVLGGTLVVAGVGIWLWRKQK